MSRQLRADAALLLENERVSSAYALAILALEEQGKHLIKLWNEPEQLPKAKRKGNSHLTKQAAVGSVLLIYPLFKHGFIERMDEVRGLLAKQSYDIAGFLSEGSEGAWVQLMELGVFNKLKHLALYHDDWSSPLSLSQNSFEPGMVDEVFRIMGKVEILLTCDESVLLGREIFLVKMARDAPDRFTMPDWVANDQKSCAP